MFAAYKRLKIYCLGRIPEPDPVRQGKILKFATSFASSRGDARKNLNLGNKEVNIQHM